MARGKKTYRAELRRRMVELVQAGRSPEERGKEFEPSANAIRNWATQSDIDEGLRADGLSTAERKELRELRRKVKQPEMEREILGKAAAWLGLSDFLCKWPVSHAGTRPGKTIARWLRAAGQSCIGRVQRSLALMMAR